MTVRYGQFFSSVTGRNVADHDGLSEIEFAVEQVLHKKLNLVRSSSNVIAARGNIFKYSKGALDGIDRRIDALMSGKR